MLTALYSSFSYIQYILVLYRLCEEVQEFDSQSLTMNTIYICLSASFKILLLASGLPGLLIVLFHTIVLGWIVEIPFGNSRVDSKMSEFMDS